MGGLDFGAIMELVNGIMGATKPKEEGQQGFEIDFQKLGMVALSFAGRQGISWVLSNRRQKKEAKMLSMGIKPDAKADKKGGKFVPGLVIGAVLGIGGYLLSMKPEDREALFKNVDRAINEIMSLVGEFQGRPYSNNYERK